MAKKLYLNNNESFYQIKFITVMKNYQSVEIGYNPIWIIF